MKAFRYLRIVRPYLAAAAVTRRLVVIPKLAAAYTKPVRAIAASAMVTPKVQVEKLRTNLESSADLSLFETQEYLFRKAKKNYNTSPETSIELYEKIEPSLLDAKLELLAHYLKTTSDGTKSYYLLHNFFHPKVTTNRLSRKDIPPTTISIYQIQWLIDHDFRETNADTWKWYDGYEQMDCFLKFMNRSENHCISHAVKNFIWKFKVDHMLYDINTLELLSGKEKGEYYYEIALIERKHLKNLVKAEEYLKLAGECNEPRACFELGKGCVVSDPDAANNYFHRAVKYGGVGFIHHIVNYVESVITKK
ncbi:MAG: hypothetical protein Hyperionvirus7_12 [Hyperionvirus sp.]|uniref:Uncharacterized protein n=1 Tax=Hyperionvirus sp. TaxID=2487770 RepID=A0A3G5AB29_9VIRU|nr:MAG: hypothetical protein Hyperionvirus7_12 [Hyperionvirus sp.]